MYGCSSAEAVATRVASLRTQVCQTEETKSKREREEAPHDEAALAPEGPGVPEAAHRSSATRDHCTSANTAKHASSPMKLVFF